MAALENSEADSSGTESPIRNADAPLDWKRRLGWTILLLIIAAVAAVALLEPRGPRGYKAVKGIALLLLILILLAGIWVPAIGRRLFRDSR